MQQPLWTKQYKAEKKKVNFPQGEKKTFRDSPVPTYGWKLVYLLIIWKMEDQ